MGVVIPFDKAAQRVRIRRKIAELEAQRVEAEHEAAKALAILERWRLPCQCGHKVFKVYWFDSRPHFHCEQCHAEPEQSRKLMVITPEPGGGQ